MERAEYGFKSKKIIYDNLGSKVNGMSKELPQSEKTANEKSKKSNIIIPLVQ